MTENTPQAAMAATRAVIQANLKEISKEILEWRDTGILTDGRLREANAFLQTHIRHDSLRLVETIARDMALEFVLAHS
jgi:hypothetical protein